MPMPRLFGVFACLLLVLSTFLGQLIMPRPAAAATVTTTSDAELRSGPGYDQPVIGTVLAGAGLAVNGPPENEFYPVTVNGQTGWVHGAVLNFVKDVAPAAETVATAPETAAPAPELAAAPTAAEPATVAAAPEGGTAAPVSAWDPQQVAQEVPIGDHASTDGQAGDPSTAVTTDGTDGTAPPPAETGATDAAGGADSQASNGADGQISNGGPAVPVAGTDDGAAPVDPATGTATPPADQGVTSAAATPTPATTPAPALTGNATVPGGANLFQNPDSSSYVLFWVPAGSTVWRLGETRNGFVYVDYMAMIGWVPADQLAEPVAVMAEVVPETAPRAENVRTPRPGSGVAFTTVELTLRAGPSANEASLDVVPAGKRVVMTGVMENGFHRVEYRGTLGWVASDYLSTPPDPTAVPATEPAVGGNNNRNGNRNNNQNNQNYDNTTARNQKSYTRDEIVSIIYAAADRYGQDRADMLRVAECESALDPYAVHPSGSYGLFQFIRSTWKSTPYGDQSMFDPAANSNAAAWMWAQGRRSEWVCK
jgi:uncharacterized protein YraI